MSDPLLSSWSVGSIVADLCSRAGIPYDAIDAALLEGLCDGFYVTGGSASAASAIQALAGVYQFDSSNYDGALHFIPRGGTSIVDITDDDLVDDGNDIEMQTRADPINIPRVMLLRYFDTNGGLTPNQQISDRSNDYRATSEEQRETVVIMDADQAMAAITIQHKAEIEEQRGEKEFTLPVNWLFLTVADVIHYNGERMRITSVDIDDCVQKYRASFDRASAYIGSGNSLPVVEPSTPPDLVPADTVLHILDCHILQDSHDRLGIYVAVAGDSDNWNGALIQYSRDNGSTWISGGAMRTSATMGELLTELPVGPVYYPDYRNYVDIELLRDDMTLISATLTEMMNRSNLCIIGDELINFSEVEQLSETTWRLSGFLRGRKGSTCEAHTVGERFVLLNPGMVSFVAIDAFNVGVPLLFRATSLGAETTDETQAITLVGRSQRERAPSYLRARRYKDSEYAQQKITISWYGTGRLGGGQQARMGAFFRAFYYEQGDTFFPSETAYNSFTENYSAGKTFTIYQRNTLTGNGTPAEVTAA